MEREPIDAMRSRTAGTLSAITAMTIAANTARKRQRCEPYAARDLVIHCNAQLDHDEDNYGVGHKLSNSTRSGPEPVNEDAQFVVPVDPVDDGARPEPQPDQGDPAELFEPSRTAPVI